MVDGCKQVSGIDYTDIAPVLPYSTLRIFIAIAPVHCFLWHLLDVESVFIYAPLYEDIYMHPHPELHVPPICMLNK